MVVHTVRIVVPAYLRGKGPNYDIIRDTYITYELRKYADKREAQLVKKRAKLAVKKILDPNM